jgi:CSLREA domain-containing protein
MRVRLTVGLAGLAAACLPVTAMAAPVRLELTAPARVAAGDAFTIDVQAPGAGRVGAFAASVGYARQAASISAALPLVRGGFPVGGEDGRVGFYGATGVAPRTCPLGVISFEPSRTGVYRIRITQATLYDPAGRVIADAPSTTLTVRVGGDRTVLSGRPLTLTTHPAAARVLASAGVSDAAQGQAGLAAAFFARGQASMAEVQALQARAAKAPAVRRQPAATTATWTVTTTADLPDTHGGDGVCGTSQGTCSLRAAVTEANAHSGPDLIAFHVAANSGIYSIFSLSSGGPLSLSDRSGGTTIDGYTQPGSSANTDPTLSNARNLIYIDNANGNSRFVVTAGGNVFRGLSFSSHGSAIQMEAGGNNNRFVGNWFGFSATGGNAHAGTGYGVQLNSTSGNVIGTPAPADRNVFGNWGYGTHSEGYTTHNTVQNNLFGITPSGAPSPMVCTGTDWNAGAHSNQIGGLGPNEGNHYAMARCEGVELSHGYTSSGTPPGGVDRWNNEFNNVQGNTFGLDAFGRYAGGAYM